MRKIIALIICLFLSLTLYAEVLENASVGMNILEIGSGARGLAMAGALTPFVDDTGSTYWNPAGLGLVKKTMITTTFSLWFADTTGQRLTAAIPAGPGAAGVDIVYMGYGSFNTSDEQGGALNGTVSAYDLVIEAGYGMKIIRYFWGGVSVKYIRQSLGLISLNGFAGDLGIQYRDGRVAAGGVIKNIGTGGAFSLPLSAEAGASYTFTPAQGHGLLAASGISFAAGGNLDFSAALEYAYAGMLAARAGYKINTVKDYLSGLKGLSLGAGFRAMDFVLDYAFLPFGELGTSHTIGLSYIFGEPAKPIQEKKK